MARKTSNVPDAAETENTDMALLTQAPDDWEFETVVTETPTQVILEEKGETFIGRYEGRQTITPDSKPDKAFDVLVFRGRDDNLYSMSPGYKLEKAFDDIEKESWVRITLMALIDTGYPGNPMKDYKVEVKR